MARYSHGYKKQSAEQTLLKIIVGIIGAVLIFVLVAFGYTKLTQWEDYAHYNSVSSYAGILADKASDANYVVYMYETSGSNAAESASFKKDVLRAGYKVDNNGGRFYVSDVSSFKSSDTGQPAFLTATNQTNMAIPALIVVVNGAFNSVITDKTEMVTALNQIADGTYAPFN